MVATSAKAWAASTSTLCIPPASVWKRLSSRSRCPAGAWAGPSTEPNPAASAPGAKRGQRPWVRARSWFTAGLPLR